MNMNMRTQIPDHCGGCGLTLIVNRTRKANPVKPFCFAAFSIALPALPVRAENAAREIVRLKPVKASFLVSSAPDPPKAAVFQDDNPVDVVLQAVSGVGHVFFRPVFQTRAAGADVGKPEMGLEQQFKVMFF
jgi:hypothetical protein